MQVFTVTKTIQVKAFIISPSKSQITVVERTRIYAQIYQINDHYRLSLARYREILGKEFENCSDDQIDQIRILAEVYADKTISNFIAKQRQQRPEIKSEEGYNGK